MFDHLNGIAIAMKDDRRGLRSVTVQIALTTLMLVAALPYELGATTNVNYDGLWKGSISCPATSWGGQNAAPLNFSSERIEIKSGSISQDIRYTAATGRTVLNKISLNLNIPEPSLIVTQTYDPSVLQPPGTPANFNWRFEFAMTNFVEGAPISGRMLNPQSGNTRPCTVTLTSLEPAPGSLADRRVQQVQNQQRSSNERVRSNTSTGTQTSSAASASTSSSNPRSSASASTAQSSEAPNAAAASRTAATNPQSAASSGRDQERIRLRDQFSGRIGRETADQLFLGNDADFIFFSNESSGAPHFARRLNGESFFRQDRANICRLLAVNNPAIAYRAFVSSEFSRGLTGLTLVPQEFLQNQCSLVEGMSGADLIVIQRSDLIRNPEIQSNLAQAIEARRIRLFKIISRSSFDALLEARNDAFESFKRALDSNSLEGFGWIVVHTQSENICAPATIEAEFIRRAVAELGLNSFFDRNPPISAPIGQFTDSDQIFLSAKAGRCGFIFGEGSFLSLFYNALKRDGFNSEAASRYLSRETAENLRLAVERDRRESSRILSDHREEEERRRIETQRTRSEAQIEADRQAQLEEARRRNDENARREELERTRTLVSTRARALVDEFSGKVQRHLESVRGEIGDLRTRVRRGIVLSEAEQRQQQQEYRQARIEALFPEWSSRVSRKFREEWEYGNITASLQDYGQSVWRNRRIETVAIRVEFPVSNRIIGERQTDCEVFFYINDEEFSMYRNNKSVPCAEYENSFREWRTINQFVSQWNLNPR